MRDKTRAKRAVAACQERAGGSSAIASAEHTLRRMEEYEDREAE